MAIEDHSFRGKVGPIVVYRMKGKNIIRSLPSPYQQTPATKARGLNFGVATRLGAQIRSGLKKILPFPKDNSMQTSLAGTISRWLTVTPLRELQPTDDIMYLSDFRFNYRSMVSMKWRNLLQIHKSTPGEMLLNIPAFIPADVVTNAPAWTETIECRLGVVSCSLAEQKFKTEFVTSIHFPWDHNEIPAQQIVLPASLESGNIVLVVAAMIYTLNKKGEVAEATEAAFRPADVIRAIYC